MAPSPKKQGSYAVIVFNAVIIAITIFNLIWLYTQIAKRKEIAAKHGDNTVSVPSGGDQESGLVYRALQGVHKHVNVWSDEDPDREWVVRCYFIFTTFPSLLSIVGTLCVHFPGSGAWILPIMDFVLAIGFMAFVHMLFCATGEEYMREKLSGEQDTCGAKEKPFSCQKICTCLLRENAYLGIRFRAKLCGILLLRSFWSYLDLILDAGVGSSYEKSPGTILLTIAGIACTMPPVQILQSVEAQIREYIRIKGTELKVKFMFMLIPLTMIQSQILTIFVSAGVIKDLGAYNANNRATRLQGFLLVFEMFIFSLLWLRHFYHPDDFDNWVKR